MCAYLYNKLGEYSTFFRTNLARAVIGFKGPSGAGAGGGKKPVAGCRTKNAETDAAERTLVFLILIQEEQCNPTALPLLLLVLILCCDSDHQAALADVAASNIRPRIFEDYLSYRPPRLWLCLL